MIIGLIEHDRGKLNELSLEMLTVARALAARAGLPLQALVVGAEGRALAETAAAYGASLVHVAEHPGLTDYAPEAWAQCVVELARAQSAQAVLAAGSDRGNEVMAHAAARLDLPLAANCTEIEPGEPYQVTRARWGGSLLEEARLKGAVKLMTVAPHARPAERLAGGGAAAEVRAFTPGLSDKDLRVRVVRREAAADKVALGEARVVVGGGRGVGSAEGFKVLEDLAEALGGAVGCSRAVTSLGWRPHQQQIGQTGQRIAPDIYIACGLSGAIQHMVGCRAAKRILAINTDAEAPVVAQADYAVIGDLHEVVPAITAALREAKGR